LRIQKLLSPASTHADAHARSFAVLKPGPQLTAKSNRTGWRLEIGREQGGRIDVEKARPFYIYASTPFPLAELLYFRRKSVGSVTGVSG